MTRAYSLIVAIAATLCFAAQADEIKPKQADPSAPSSTEKLARADDSTAKLANAMKKDAPVSFQKSEYNDFMTNVAWMNRNGFVVGAPAWKGGEDGLHCH